MLIQPFRLLPSSTRFVQYLDNRCRYNGITPFGNEKNRYPFAALVLFKEATHDPIIEFTDQQKDYG